MKKRITHEIIEIKRQRVLSFGLILIGRGIQVMYTKNYYLLFCMQFGSDYKKKICCLEYLHWNKRICFLG